mgnify:FL=1
MEIISFLKRAFLVILVLFFSFSANAQQVNILTESFENGGSTPLGWVTEVVSGANYITFESSSSNPMISNAADGIYFVRFNSYNASIGVINSLKRISSLSTIGLHNIVVSFKWYEDSGNSTSLDRVIVEWSSNGLTWIEAGTFNRYNLVEGWKDRSVVLPSAAGNIPNLYVAFKFVSASGNNCSLDIVKINGLPDPVEIGRASCRERV